MKNTFAIMIMGMFGFLVSCSQPKPVDLDNAVLIPAPVSFQGMSGSPFSLNAQVKIAYTDVALQKVAEQLAADLLKQTDLSFAVEATASPKNNTIYLELNPQPGGLANLNSPIGVSPKDANPQDEKYILDISSKGITVRATSTEGIYRGITSLRQLIYGSKTADGKIQLAPLTITDSPKFAWRGLSLDVSRYFLTVEEVKETIDKMALYKMNVLHFHLTDNQGWRIEIKKYPKLTEVGAFVPNNDRKGG